MDYFYIVLSCVLALVGFAGAIIPGIPGTIVSYLAFIALLPLPTEEANASFLITTGIVALVVTVVDFLVPIYGTKKLGGTKKGVWGSTIGLLVSIFVLPFLGIVIGPFGIIGILLGPFLGAYIGELLAHNEDKAMKAALGSFVGFLAGTFLKCLYGIFVIVFVVKSIINFFSV